MCRKDGIHAHSLAHTYDTMQHTHQLIWRLIQTNSVFLSHFSLELITVIPISPTYF